MRKRRRILFLKFKFLVSILSSEKEQTLRMHETTSIWSRLCISIQIISTWLDWGPIPQLDLKLILDFSGNKEEKKSQIFHFIRGRAHQTLGIWFKDILSKNFCWFSLTIGEILFLHIWPKTTNSWQSRGVFSNPVENTSYMNGIVKAFELFQIVKLSEKKKKIFFVKLWKKFFFFTYWTRKLRKPNK